jgi:hypothetical protein
MTVTKTVMDFIKSSCRMPAGMVFAVVCVSLSWSSTAVLQSVIPPGSPIIRGKQIIYSVNFIFDRCPKRYWSYPEDNNKTVVVEVYDFVIKAADSLKMRFSSPLKAVEINNASTSIVLSGQKSQILVRFNEQIHSEAECRGDTLVLTVWKELPPGRKIAKKTNKTVVLSGIILLVCATLTALYFRSLAVES